MIRTIYWWRLPDDSGEIVVCEPRSEHARKEIQKLASQGITLLPHQYSAVPLTAQQAALVASMNLPASATAQDLYEEVAARSLLPHFSPHT